ncbi:MAG: M43 family zinc metalloprotease [Flavisolibacter sp.]
MRTFVFVICIFFAFTVRGQRNCVTQSYLEFQKSANPALSQRLADIENFVQHQRLAARVDGAGAASVITIPVAVHILYSTPSQNISDEQVISQVAALNRDFRRDNGDSVNTPDRFKRVAADVQIEFALAKADPQGRPTTGIVHKQTTVSSWKSDDKIKYSSQGGDDAWDSRYYLNIWVGNLLTVIGYSSVPGCPADKDGVVITTSVFGTLNVGGVYNLGRTAVHEVGHWLGLKHIWGDYYCGDDLVDDTPKQGNFTPGCPNGFRSSCDNGTVGDMYMNYMDYTADACMNLFTEGQKRRMRSLFSSGGPRSTLMSSKGLNEPWTAAAPLPESPVSVSRLYPNPAASEIMLTLDPSWIGKSVKITNLNGGVWRTERISASSQKINLSALPPGLYFLLAENEGVKLREKFLKL